MREHSGNISISPDVYDRGYLLSDSLEGYEEYLQGALSAIKARQLEMLALTPALSLLEIGYGRGEFLRHCAMRCHRASGIDYSPSALEIASQTLRDVSNADIRVADCRELPFASDSFDRVYSGDVIEHMSFADGTVMLREAFRVLRPGGFLLVHTSPNSVFVRLVYPLARLALRLSHPESVVMMDRHIEASKRVHVFEFNLISLRRIARHAGLPAAAAWIDADLLRGGSTWHTRGLRGGALFRLVGGLGRFATARYFLGNDLYLRCTKPAPARAD